jgi:hypothetical protein
MVPAATWKAKHGRAFPSKEMLMKVILSKVDPGKEVARD